MISTVLFEVSGALADWERSVALAAKDILPDVTPGLQARFQGYIREAFWRI